jgi:hypothetical protein
MLMLRFMRMGRGRAHQTAAPGARAAPRDVARTELTLSERSRLAHATTQIGNYYPVVELSLQHWNDHAATFARRLPLEDWGSIAARNRSREGDESRPFPRGHT